MNEPTFSIADYIAILRRRIWWFVVPAVVVVAGAVVMATTLPPVYRSSALVLIEEPELPEELMSINFSTAVERRLEAISRRVMVTDNLVGIIERFGLYPEARAETSMTALAGRMRDAIGIRTLGTETVGQRRGSGPATTVAFELSFRYGSAAPAQRVANELVSLYLNENIRQRRERVTETANFLAQERARVEARIAELTRQLADFQVENRATLPDQAMFNQQMLTRAEGELRDLDRQESTLRDRETLLTAQLAGTPARLAGAVGAPSSPATRLEAARMQLASLTALYTPSHPDVLRARTEVAALEALVRAEEAVGARREGDPVAAEHERREAELARLRETYEPEHPDVLRAERALAALPATPPTADTEAAANADNPVFLSLEAELSIVRRQLAALEATREGLRERYAFFEDRLARTPETQRSYERIAGALSDARTERDSLVEKEQAARLGQAVETEQRGERFSLIEPASLPGVPESPNRRMILLVGVVLALGAGGGAVTLRQLLDDTVGGPGDVTREIGFEPLGIVPTIMTPRERAFRLGQRVAIVGVLVVTVGAGTWYVHTRVTPLDTAALAAWQSVVTRIGPYLPGDLQAQLGMSRP